MTYHVRRMDRDARNASSPEERPSQDGGAVAGKRVPTMRISRASEAPAPPRVPDAARPALEGEQGEPLADGDAWSAELGADVRGARLVTGAPAARAAAALEARAFTAGNRVFFGEGHGPGDRDLLRHELTHVAQQRDAAPPAHWTDLAISAPASAEEQAARGAGPVAATGAGIMRDPEVIDDAAYLTRHADRVMTALVGEVRRLPLTLAHPGARLREGGSAALAEALVVGLGSGAAGLAALRRILVGETLEHAVERGRPHRSVMMAPEGRPEEAEPWRTSDGPATWYPAVAIEIATLVHRALQASLARVGPRYATAYQAALQAAWASNGACDPNATVTVDASAIIPAAPIDRELAAALCAGDHVAVDPPDPAATVEAETLRPVTFQFLGHEGQEGWLRVTPIDARPEEVAQSLYGDPALAYTLTPAGHLYQFDGSRVLAAYRDQLTEHERSGYERVGDTSSLTGAHADELALAQAGPGCIGTTADIVRDMRDTVRVLDGIIEQARTFGPMLGPDRIVAARDRVDQRSRDLAAQPEGSAAAWGAQAAEQKQLVGRAATGLDQAVVQLASMADLTEDRGAVRLPQYVRHLILGLAQGYADVAVWSDQAAIARGKLEQADARSTMYPLDLMDHILAEVQQSLSDVQAGGNHGGDARRLQGRQEELRRRAAEVRARIIADPTSLGRELQTLQAEVADLQTETSIVANMDAIDSAFAVLDDTNGFWATVTFYDDDLDALKTEGQGYHRRWRTIYQQWQNGEHAEARAGLDALRQDEGFRGYLGRVQAEVQDARIAAAIAQLAAMLVVIVITAGVGAYVGGAAAGAGWSTGAVAAAQVTAEAATFTALNTVLFERDPTVQGVAGEFLFNLALFGAMRGISMIARAGALGRTVQAGGAAGIAIVGAEYTANFLLLHVAGMVREDLARRDQGLPPPTEEEQRELFLQNLAMFVVAAVITNLLRRPLLEPLERAGGRLTTRARQLRVARAALGERAEGLRGSRDVEAARELLRAERGNVEEELAEFRRFEQEIERAATPEERAQLLERAGVTEEQYGQMREGASESQAHLAQMRRAELLMALDPIGPNLFAAPREQVPELLRSHQEQGARIEVGQPDPVTGERLYNVRYPDGQSLRIVERAGSARPGAIGQRPPTETEALAAQAEAQRAIEIQDRRNAQLQTLVDSVSIVEVDHAIAGGGVAATMDYATLPSRPGMAAPGADVTEIPSTFAIGGREAWRARAEGLTAAAAQHGAPEPLLGGGRIGQPVGQWANEGFTRQPGEFTSDHAGLGRAADVGRAVAMTQFETGMTTYDGVVVSLEVNPRDGSWPSERPLRLRVASATNPIGEFYVYANTVDAALGRGAARSLTVDDPASGRRGQVDPADMDALLGDRRLVYYDQMFQHPSTGRVLVFGNGPTAVWAAGTAAEVGAQVTVLGMNRGAIERADTARSTVDVTRPDAAAELARIEQQLAQETFATTRGIVNDRYFDHPSITWRGGNIARVQPGDASVPGEAGKIVVELTGGGREVYDQVALSIGQDPTGGGVRGGVAGPAGGPGVGSVVGGLEFRMVITDGRLVALESVNPPGRVRLLGASMSESIAERVIASERSEFLSLVRDVQPRDPSVPAESRGVQDSIYQLGQNIPRANETPRGTEPPATSPHLAPLHDDEDEAGVCLPDGP